MIDVTELAKYGVSTLIIGFSLLVIDRVIGFMQRRSLSEAMHRCISAIQELRRAVEKRYDTVAEIDKSTTLIKEKTFGTHEKINDLVNIAGGIDFEVKSIREYQLRNTQKKAI